MSDEPGGRPQVAAELNELLQIICSAATEDEVARRLGTARPSHGPVHRFRVEPTAFRSFRAIEFRPWQDDQFGLVDVTLESTVDVFMADFATVLGPLQPVPRLHGGPQRLQGIFEAPGLPAWAAVYLELEPGAAGDDGRVTSISVRTEPPVEEVKG